MKEAISNTAQIASVRRYILADGIEKGLEVLDCDNGKLRFLLNVGKALDIMQLYYKGENLSFVSKNGFTAREIPFVRRFEGGMLYTCGLDSVGGRDGYELHGNLHQTPARLVRVQCDDKEIVVEAEIRCTALFGEDLLLKRRISCPVGGDTLYLHDELCNAGYLPAEYALLYHVNLGYPMLCEGCLIEADAAECRPRTPWSAEKQAEWRQITKPLPGQEENCYFLAMRKPQASLTRPDGRRFTLSYSGDTLPHFIEWKSMASGDYALGFEPCTTFLDGEFSCCSLQPGETVAFDLSFSVNE